MGESDPFLSLGFLSNFNNSDFTYIPSNAQDDTFALLKKSSLVCVYDSSLGMDAIFERLPLLVFGMPYFQSVLPKKFKSTDDIVLEDLDSMIYSIEDLLPWAFYLRNSGHDLLI